MTRPIRTSRIPAAVLAASLALTCALVGAAAPPARAASAYDSVVDLTFPVAGTTWYGDSYHAPRGGGTRVHMATDIMADYGQSVHAAVGGIVSYITGVTSPVPSHGYMITIDGDDGRRYSYIHLGRQDAGPESAYLPGIVRGARVARGQAIGTVGCSGNASCSAPHLHFEVFDEAITDPYGGHRRNPYRSLLAAEGRGDYPVAARRGDGCIPSGSVPATPVRRVNGSGPVATSAAVSRAGWASADEALIATAGDFADALAGAALSAKRDAPLLLVGDALAAATRDELARLGVERVTILGGAAAVADAVAASIDAVVPHVDRLAGADRFDTAAAIQRAVGVTGPEVALAVGRHDDPNRSWPDAISASALAAGSTPVPVLLTRNDGIPAATAAALAESRARNIKTVLIIGGSVAIEAPVEAQVRALGFEVRRLAGADRYETSLAIAKVAAARSGMTGRLVAASGISFADALPGGPLAARVDGTLLLVPPCGLDRVPGVVKFLDGRYRDGYVIGAQRAVSEGVREVLTDVIAG